MPSPSFRGGRVDSVGCDVGRGGGRETVKTSAATARLGTSTLATAALGKRLASAVVFIPAFVWLVTRGPHWGFLLLVIAVGALASWELTRMLEPARRALDRWTAIVAGVAVTASFVAPGGPRVVLTLAVLLVLAAAIWRTSPPSVAPAMVTILSFTYVSWLLGHAVLLHRSADGPEFVLFVVSVTWAGESAAYVVGSAIGRHKLAPVISPRKTVEGAVAQVVVAAAIALVVNVWLLPEWTVAQTIVAGLLLGVVGQVGDLVESVMKRSVGAKDTGGLIPGHGGVLDRLDSLLFNLPAFFYYVTFVRGAG